MGRKTRTELFANVNLLGGSVMLSLKIRKLYGACKDVHLKDEAEGSKYMLMSLCQNFRTNSKH
jgi:hypothetical protein